MSLENNFFRTRPATATSRFIKTRTENTSEAGQKTARRTGVNFWRGSCTFAVQQQGATLLAELEQADEVGGFFFADLAQRGIDPAQLSGRWLPPNWSLAPEPRNSSNAIISGQADRLAVSTGFGGNCAPGDIVSIQNRIPGVGSNDYVTARIIASIDRGVSNGNGTADVLRFTTPLPYEFVYDKSRPLNRIYACINRPHVRAKLMGGDNIQYTAARRWTSPATIEWYEDTGGNATFLRQALRSPALPGVPQGDERFFLTEDQSAFIVAEDGRYLTTES